MPPFSSTLLQPRPSSRYYALLAERFCKLKREYSDCFSEAFVRQYQLIHRWVLDVWPRGWQCAQGAWPVLALCPLVSQWSRPAPQAHSSPGLSPPACVCFSRRFSECALPSSWRDRTCARAPCRQSPTSNAPPRPKKETKTLLNNPHPNPYPPTPQPAGWQLLLKGVGGWLLLYICMAELVVVVAPRPREPRPREPLCTAGQGQGGVQSAHLVTVVNE